MPASWDTILSKPASLLAPDRLLVWGEATADQAHAQGYLRVVITGPPHWDVYGEPCQKNPEPLVLVAGTSVHYWADEGQIVHELVRESLATNRAWEVRYRPHPSRLKNPAFQPPKGVALDDRLGYDLGPGFQEHLHSVLEQSACVVAAFSTLIIEAALMGRPSIVPAFAQSAHGIGGVIAHAELDHMREVVSWPGVHVTRTLPGLIGAVRKAVAGTLEHDPAELRRRALKIARVGGAQERIIAAIENA